MNVDQASRFNRRLLIACVFFCFASTLNTQTFGLLLVRIAETTGLSIPAMGGLRTLENVASIGVAVLAAPIVDRYPRRWPLVAGVGSGLIAALVLWAFPTSLGVAVYLLLNGTAVMLAISTALAIPGDFLRDRRLNRVMGFMIAGFALSEIVFLPVAGRVADQFGWRSAYLLTAGMLIVAGIIALLVAPGESIGQHAPPAGLRSRYRDILENRRLLLMLVAALMRFAQYGALLTFLSAILTTRFHLSVSRIGLIFALVGVMSFSGSALSGFILHAGRNRTALVEGGLVVAVLCAGALILHLPTVPTVLLIVLVMFALAVQENASTLTVLEQSPELRGAAMTLNELSAASGALTGIGLGSIGLDLAGVSGLGLVLTFLAVLGALGTWYVVRPGARVLPALSDDSI